MRRYFSDAVVFSRTDTKDAALVRWGRCVLFLSFLHVGPVT